MQSFEELKERAVSVGVLTQAQIHEICARFGSIHLDSDDFLKAAVRKGMLTNYQVERLTSDEPYGFYYGPYKILYIVGAGTFARVFRGEHRDDASMAAVKVLRARFSDNKTVVDHFLNEAKLGTQLQHPNIVPIYSASSEGYLHFMTMEFVEGQTLREFVKVRKKVDPKTATLITRDVASGLEYAIRKGLQHRDLKLSNVMLSSSGQAKIVDFGLASIAERGASIDVPFLKNQQSVDYVALERAPGAKKDDPRSDLYFLGCMYYQMLGGESPFLETKDRTKRLDRNRFYNVKPLYQIDSSIPQIVAQIVAKAMQPDADSRYQSPTMMIYDLNKALEKLDAGSAAAPSSAAGAGATRTGGSTSEFKRGILVVDSNETMQNVLREAFKKSGFRVLVFASPERAIERLADDDGIVQCLLFNATSLGLRAVRAFNEAGSRLGMKDLPAVLLLDENQSGLIDEAHAGRLRIILQMPITIRQLREKIAALLEADARLKMDRLKARAVPES